MSTAPCCWMQNWIFWLWCGRALAQNATRLPVVDSAANHSSKWCRVSGGRAMTSTSTSAITYFRVPFGQKDAAKVCIMLQQTQAMAPTSRSGSRQRMSMHTMDTHCSDMATENSSSACLPETELDLGRLPSRVPAGHVLTWPLHMHCCCRALANSSLWHAGLGSKVGPKAQAMVCP